MLENLTNIVTNFLEINGYESDVDYTNEIITYEADNNIKIFCRLNEEALSKIIEKYNIEEYETFY